MSTTSRRSASNDAIELPWAATDRRNASDARESPKSERTPEIMSSRSRHANHCTNTSPQEPRFAQPLKDQNLHAMSSITVSPIINEQPLLRRASVTLAPSSPAEISQYFDPDGHYKPGWIPKDINDRPTDAAVDRGLENLRKAFHASSASADLSPDEHTSTAASIGMHTIDLIRLILQQAVTHSGVSAEQILYAVSAVEAPRQASLHQMFANFLLNRSTGPDFAQRRKFDEMFGQPKDEYSADEIVDLYRLFLENVGDKTRARRLLAWYWLRAANAGLEPTSDTLIQDLREHLVSMKATADIAAVRHGITTIVMATVARTGLRSAPAHSGIVTTSHGRLLLPNLRMSADTLLQMLEASVVSSHGANALSSGELRHDHHHLDNSPVGPSRGRSGLSASVHVPDIQPAREGLEAIHNGRHAHTELGRRIDLGFADLEAETSGIIGPPIDLLQFYPGVQAADHSHVRFSSTRTSRSPRSIPLPLNAEAMSDDLGLDSYNLPADSPAPRMTNEGLVVDIPLDDGRGEVIYFIVPAGRYKLRAWVRLPLEESIPDEPLPSILKDVPPGGQNELGRKYSSFWHMHGIGPKGGGSGLQFKKAVDQASINDKTMAWLPGLMSLPCELEQRQPFAATGTVARKVPKERSLMDDIHDKKMKKYVFTVLSDYSTQHKILPRVRIPDAVRRYLPSPLDQSSSLVCITYPITAPSNSIYSGTCRAQTDQRQLFGATKIQQRSYGIPTKIKLSGTVDSRIGVGHIMEGGTSKHDRETPQDDYGQPSVEIYAGGSTETSCENSKWAKLHGPSAAPLLASIDVTLNDTPRDAKPSATAMLRQDTLDEDVVDSLVAASSRSTTPEIALITGTQGPLEQQLSQEIDELEEDYECDQNVGVDSLDRPVILSTSDGCSRLGPRYSPEARTTDSCGASTGTKDHPLSTESGSKRQREQDLDLNSDAVVKKRRLDVL